MGSNVIMWDQCYHVGVKLSCGINVIMWGSNVIMWDKINHVGVECYYVGSNVIM